MSAKSAQWSIRKRLKSGDFQEVVAFPAGAMHHAPNPIRPTTIAAKVVARTLAMIFRYPFFRPGTSLSRSASTAPYFTAHAGYRMSPSMRWRTVFRYHPRGAGTSRATRRVYFRPPASVFRAARRGRRRFFVPGTERLGKKTSHGASRVAHHPVRETSPGPVSEQDATAGQTSKFDP